jgi:multisubunit Na+/H+ antiporter MnhF subunit
MHLGVFYLALAWSAGLIAVMMLLVLCSRSVIARLLALDTLTLLLVALLVVVARHETLTFYLDVALALALVSFIGTLAAARYLGEHRMLS